MTKWDRKEAEVLVASVTAENANPLLFNCAAMLKAAIREIEQLSADAAS